MLKIGSIIKTVANVADELVTTKEEILKAELQEKKIDANLAMGQIEINKIEAASKSVFVSGWRPFIGWICGFSLLYSFIIRDLIVCITSFFQLKIGVLPVLQTNDLLTLTLGLLGLGGLRTFEKLKGINSDSLNKRKQ